MYVIFYLVPITALLRSYKLCVSYELTVTAVSHKSGWKPHSKYEQYLFLFFCKFFSWACLEKPSNQTARTGRATFKFWPSGKWPKTFLYGFISFWSWGLNNKEYIENVTHINWLKKLMVCGKMFIANSAF